LLQYKRHLIIIGLTVTMFSGTRHIACKVETPNGVHGRFNTEREKWMAVLCFTQSAWGIRPTLPERSLHKTAQKYLHIGRQQKWQVMH